MRPHSTGHTSMTGRSQMTIPPEWMPRWRGASSTCRARSITGCGIPCSGVFAVDVTVPHPSTRLDQASCWPGRVAERLGHVAHRRLGAVGDDVGDLRRVVPPVLGVDVLDDLLAPVALDVDVDVGRPVALGRQEALEQQAERHGVGGGDAEGVADGRVGGAAPALAEDVLLPAEPHEVPHDEEVAGEAELLDDRQLVVDRAPRPGPQRRHLACPVRRRPAGARRSGGGRRRRRAGAGTPSRSARRGTRTAAATGRRARGRRRRPARPRRPARRRPGSGRSGGAARHPSGGGRRPRRAATGRARRGCGATAPRRGRWPGGAAPAWRSGRSSWRRSRRRGGRPARRGRRCAPSRAGRRGPTARRARGRARTPRSTAAARGGRPPARRRATPAAPPPCGSRSAPTRRRRCCGRRRRA